MVHSTLWITIEQVKSSGTSCWASASHLELAPAADLSLSRLFFPRVL